MGKNTVVFFTKMSTNVSSSPAVVTASSNGTLQTGSGKGNGGLSDASSSSSLPVVLRVSQLDAHQLDNELLEIIFLKQLGKCFDCFDVNIASKYKEEMKLFLEFLLWFKTVRVSKPTPGMEMMNVTYLDEKGIAQFGSLREQQKWTLLLCGSVCKYLYSKATNFVANKCLPDETTSRVVKLLGTAHSVARTMNLILFLYSGKFPNVPQRVASVRFAHENPNAGRAMTFEYLNRALAMREITEVGKTVVMPMMESRGAREFFRRAKYVLGFRQQGGEAAARLEESDDDDEEEKEKEIENEDANRRKRKEKKSNKRLGGMMVRTIRDASTVRIGEDGFDEDVAICAACGDAPIPCNAFVAKRCGCSYCYYCAAARLEECKAEGNWKGFACENCATRINSFRRINLKTIE